LDVDGQAASRVANERYPRAVGVHFVDTSHEAIGREDGQSFANAVAGAEVDLQSAPPISRVTSDDLAEAEFPLVCGGEGDLNAEGFVFFGGGTELLDLNAENLVGEGESLVLIEQLLARGGFFGSVVMDALEAGFDGIEGYEKAPRGKLYLPSRLRR
jgi:hypothetical protein